MGILTPIVKGLANAAGAVAHNTKLAPITEDIAKSLFGNSKKMIGNFYKSLNYAQRLKQAGFNEADSNLLRNKLLGLLDKTEFKAVDGLSAANSNASKFATELAGSSTKRLPYVSNGAIKLTNGLVKLNKRANNGIKNTIGTLDHELLHSSSDNSAGLGSTIMRAKLSNGKIYKIDKGTSIIDKAMEYNKKLIDENLPSVMKNKDEFVKFYTNVLKKQNKPASPELLENLWERAKYTTSPQEWRSRGLQLQLEADRRNMSLEDYIKSNPTDNLLYQAMRQFATPLLIFNFSSKALGLATPLGIGAAALSGNLSDTSNA